jgi:hypothetical protein
MDGDQTTTQMPLLPSASVNSTDHQDDITLRIIGRNRRTSSVSRVLISDDAAATLSFHDVNYIIGGQIESTRRRIKRPTLRCFKSAAQKQILFNISGKFSNGMNAILGEIFSKFVLKVG